jgi:hypothetical protein
VSTLTKFLNLLVFGTIGEVMTCTKFLINRVCMHPHWIEKAHPIQVQYIHSLTNISMEGEDMSHAFQGARKHLGQKGEPNLYYHYDTKRGGCGAIVSIINNH